jgi:alpha-galactosidase
MKKYIALLLFAAFCSVPVCAQTKTPLMGWSSWNTYGVGISDSLIRCQADAMVRTGT